MNNEILQLMRISKSFLGVQALCEMDFHLNRGEIRALAGKNGAGKSTLIKIITGIYQHDSGHLIFETQEVRNIKTKTMCELGVRAIYQNNDLVPYFTVGESIMLNNEKRSFGGLILDRRHSERLAGDVLEKQLGVNIDTSLLIRNLNISQQQLVQIAQNLVKVPKVMIFDEPTASLSEQEISRLFEIIKGLKKEGVSVIYISHRFDEVFQLADSITILRDGRKIADLSIEDTTEQEVVSLMVGEEAGKLAVRPRQTIRLPQEPVLQVSELSNEFIQDVSFQLHKGEILGFFGSEGSSHEKIAQTLFGQKPWLTGKIRIDGKEVRIRDESEAISHGIGYVPRNRKGQGLVIDFEVRENITLPALRAFSRAGFIDTASEDAITEKLIKRLDIKVSSTRQPAKTLSGGNQQKVVIGRWIAASPRILLLDYPTSGIDVRAKAGIYEILGELTAQGLGVILISPEYEEIATLCDRVFVMWRGRIVKEFLSKEFNEAKMLRYAIGYSAGEKINDEL